MGILISLLLISLAIESATSSQLPTTQSFPRIPLTQKKTPSLAHLGRRSGTTTQTITIDSGFWFGNFSIGGAPNLNLLIDTGSGDIILNPGLYVPSKASKNLSLPFENSYGTTSSNGTGTGGVTGTLYSDVVTYGGLSATHVIGSASGTAALIPSDGIIGFSKQEAQFPIQYPNLTNTAPFIDTLCDQNVVSECRFGLALTGSGSGTLILGELDSSLYTGDLSVAPIIQQWALTGDLALEGKVIAKDILIELDSGTATVIGPIDAVTSLFNATGIQGVLQSTPDGPLLTGYFPCDKPPTVGFGFPSASDAAAAANNSTSSVSKKGSIFNIPTNQWAAANNGNNNCTAVLSGANVPNITGLWVVGQAFFQGLYIDHNLANGTVGFAPLKNGGNATSTSGSTGSPTSTTSAKPTQPTSGTSKSMSSGGLFWSFAILGALVVWV
ncbi:acid protease [Hyaloscypha variabilis F]|uniref:Acid protease n=1 Tax=Hyaloscypha variabilis (strain UAMH 11265 / GT02V1 / F) TaxID=1149755 RepID=A0A2J6RL57_HYAVF|nr:acid protease [Hyaloscypha variabilis F]